MSEIQNKSVITGKISKITEKIEFDPEFLIKAVITQNMIMFAISVVLSGRRVFLDINPLTFLQVTSESLIRLGASGSGLVFERHMWWTLLSAGYNHANLLHIVFNMLAFMSLARLIAALFGNSVMFTIYTISTITGFLMSALAGIPLTVGASAGICGLVGASIIFGTVSRDAIAIVVKKQTTGWIVSLIMMGLMIRGINNWAHGGGFLGGAVYAYFALKTAGIKGMGKIHLLLSGACVLATVLALGAAVF